jgi:hypothetical protein
MAGKRKQDAAAFKAQVALAALQGDKTVNELAGRSLRLSGGGSAGKLS